MKKRYFSVKVKSIPTRLRCRKNVAVVKKNITINAILKQTTKTIDDDLNHDDERKRYVITNSKDFKD